MKKRRKKQNEEAELIDFTLNCLGIGLISLSIAAIGISMPKKKTVVKTIKYITNNIPDL